MTSIVTLTLNPSVDSACQTDRVHPVHKIRISDERYDPGGGGINVAWVTLGLAQGRSPRAAFTLAVATGTATVLTMGTELCRRADVERFYREITARRSAGGDEQDG